MYRLLAFVSLLMFAGLIQAKTFQEMTQDASQGQQPRTLKLWAESAAKLSPNQLVKGTSISLTIGPNNFGAQPNQISFSTTVPGQMNLNSTPIPLEPINYKNLVEPLLAELKLKAKETQHAEAANFLHAQIELHYNRRKVGNDLRALIQDVASTDKAKQPAKLAELDRKLQLYFGISLNDLAPNVFLGASGLPGVHSIEGREQLGAPTQAQILDRLHRLSAGDKSWQNATICEGDKCELVPNVYTDSDLQGSIHIPPELHAAFFGGGIQKEMALEIPKETEHIWSEAARVIVFTMDNCGPCVSLKQELSGLNNSKLVYLHKGKEFTANDLVGSPGELGVTGFPTVVLFDPKTRVFQKVDGSASGVQKALGKLK